MHDYVLLTFVAAVSSLDVLITKAVQMKRTTRNLGLSFKVDHSKDSFDIIFASRERVF